MPRSIWTNIALSAAVVGVIIWQVPVVGLRVAFRSMEVGSLSLAIFYFLILLFVRAYKWHRLVEAVGKVHVRQSLRALFGGFALGLVTPGRVGELGRCVFVREEDRAQVALLTLVGVSLFYLAPHPAAVFGLAVWLAFLPVVAGFPRLLAHVSGLMRRFPYFRGHLPEAGARLPQIQSLRFAALAVCATGAELASFFFLLRAFFPAGFSTAVSTYPYIVLAGDMPVSFSGMGVREGAAALLLSPYAVPAGAAIDTTLLWFVFAILLPAALGTAWLITEWAKSRIRRTDVLVRVRESTRNFGESPAPDSLRSES